jgi:lactoylglutathione lyase
MNQESNTAYFPSRVLYTMIRVGDLERFLAFYCGDMGIRILRRETFTEDRFALVFGGYDAASPNALIELTYNWDDDSYEHGTGYGHVAL